jgi:3-hydroxyacyl-CoA dehydrogenase
VPADTPRREIQAVAVIGAGTMGGGIAMNFLNAGIPVKMLEMKQEALDRGIATIRKNYEVAGGQARQAQAGQIRAAHGAAERPRSSYQELKDDADIVIEAVFEEMGVKEAVFKQAGRA